MRFTRIRLENWRNFNKVDVELRDRVFLIGPNASGKSNFLYVFRFLRDIANTTLRGAIAENGGLKKIRALSARGKPNVAIDCELIDPDETSWRYKLVIGEKKDKPAEVIQELVESNGKVILNRPLPEDKKDQKLLYSTHLEQVRANRDFAPVVEAFQAIRYLNLVPQLVREQERISKMKNDPFGSDFIDQISEINPREQKARLKKIEEVVKIAVPMFHNLLLKKDNKGRPHLTFKHKHWRPQGAWQNEADLSDGTIRLLGLLWAFFEGSGLLLLEEPELSLHPEIVRHLPQMMYRLQNKTSRQVIISTHSTEILWDKGIAAEEVFLLTPSDNGTNIEVGAKRKQVRAMMEAGFSAAEAAFPETDPKGASQLSLFDF